MTRDVVGSVDDFADIVRELLECARPLDERVPRVHTARDVAARKVTGGVPLAAWTEFPLEDVACLGVVAVRALDQPDVLRRHAATVLRAAPLKRLSMHRRGPPANM